MANQNTPTTSEPIKELYLQIQNNLHVSSSPPSSSASKTNNTSLLLSDNIHLSYTGTALICDAWYGFPKQKRPRQERILAVSRQIYNYILWNNSELQKMKLRKNNTKNNKNHDQIEIYNQMIMSMKATMYVVGEVEDVNSIQERVDQLLLNSTDEKPNSNVDNSSGNSEKKGNDKSSEEMETKCYFLAGVTLEALCNKLSKMKSQQYQHMSSQNNIPLPRFKSDIVYLSPDASLTLNPKELPPSIVIIGMIVDRKIQNNRSKSRAEKIIVNIQNLEQLLIDDNDIKESSERKGNEQEIIVPNLNFECTRLPLDALNVSDLGSDEALNIDTVLEMVQRWWYNCGNDAMHSPNPRSSSSDNMGSKFFVDAAARALLTHRNRHPNRTIHQQSQQAQKEC